MGYACLKTLVFVFNAIFMVLGIALIVVGSLTVAQLSDFFKVLDKSYAAVPAVILVTGIVLFLVSFMGFIGVFKESVCLLNFFSGFIGFLLILQITSIVLGFVFKSKVEDGVNTALKLSIKNYYTADAYKVFMDLVQKQFQCCGSNNSTDYIKNNITVPQSCCVKSSNCTSTQSGDESPFFKSGCKDTFVKWMNQKMVILVAVAVAVCVFQLIGILISCSLSKKVSSDGTWA